MEDRQIVQMYLERNEEAIAETEKKYGRLCSSLAYGILNDPSDTEECVSDTWLGVWNSIPPNEPQSLLSYVCKVARNLAIKRYHHNTASKRNSAYTVALEELEGVLVSTKDVESEIEANELTRLIESFLDSLKQTDRILFLRRYYFSDPLNAIAERTGLTEKNVSVKLTRIRQRLRKYLKERGYIV